jgi:hypothetical protein
MREFLPVISVFARALSFGAIDCDDGFFPASRRSETALLSLFPPS